MGAVRRRAAERVAQAESLRARPARGRILAAASELAEQRGYESLTVGELADRAAVSRETFYTHFADKRACLAEATAPELGEIDALLRIAAERGSQWAEPMADTLEHALADCFSSAQTPRGRILEAMVEVAAERGFAAVRIVDVIRCAHVSHQLFYRHFESREQCFEAACEALAERLARRIEVEVGALAGEPAGVDDDGSAGVEARLVILAELLAAEPAAAKVLLVEAPQLRSWDGGDAEKAGAAGSRAGHVLSGEGIHVAPSTPLARLVGGFWGSHGGADVLARQRAGAVTETFRAALRVGAMAELPGRAREVARLLTHAPPAPASADARRPARRAPAPRRRKPQRRRSPARV